MNNVDKQLKELYEKILSKDRMKNDRTGTGTKSIFGHQLRFNMADGFPLTTLRQIHVKSLVHELLWFLGSYDDEYKKFGNTNIRYLLENGVTFWSDWCYEYYKKEKFKIYQDNDLKDSKTVKKFRYLSMKDFEKKIIADDEFALKFGDLGPVYGKQWTDWGGRHELVEKSREYRETKSDTVLTDKLGWEKVYIRGSNQIDTVIEQLMKTPDSRRIIVNAWNVDDLDDMLLPPCHMFFQFYTEVLEMEERIDYCEKKITKEDVDNYMSKNDIEDWNDIRRNPTKQVKILDHFNIPERKLSLQSYQRSVDSYLGLPYNIASYSLLLHMMAQIVDMVPHEFIHTSGDAHIYSNSFKATEELLKREPKDLPQVKIDENIEDIYKFRFEDFEIDGYDPHPNIPVKVAV